MGELIDARDRFGGDEYTFEQKLEIASGFFTNFLALAIQLENHGDKLGEEWLGVVCDRLGATNKLMLEQFESEGDDGA